MNVHVPLLTVCAHNLFSCCLGGLGAGTGLSETYAYIHSKLYCTKKKLTGVKARQQRYDYKEISARRNTLID